MKKFLGIIVLLALIFGGISYRLFIVKSPWEDFFGQFAMFFTIIFILTIIVYTITWLFTRKKTFKLTTLALWAVFILIYSPFSSIKHHTLGNIYSALSNKDKNSYTRMAVDPNYGMGVGVFVASSISKISTIFIPLDVFTTLVLETFLFPIDMFFYEDYKKNTLLENAQTSVHNKFYYKLTAYKKDYIENPNPLIKAIILEETHKYDDLLKSNSDILKKDLYNFTALDYAFLTGQIDIIKKLIEEKKASYSPSFILDVMNYRYMKPIVLQYLLQKGLDPNFKDDDSSLLIDSTRYESFSMAIMLIEAGADVNQTFKSESIVDLVRTRVDFEEFLVTLINKGMNPNLRGERGVTALQSVAGRDNARLVNLLLEKGADVNLTDNAGKTALFYSREKTTPLLVQAGADINIKNNANRTALLDRIMTWSFSQDTDYLLNMTKIFLKYGANPNITDEKNYTVLMDAFRTGNSEVIKLLIDYGASIETVNKSGKTAYDYAKDKSINKEISNYIHAKKSQ